MASLFLVRDPNPERRRRSLAAAVQKMANFGFQDPNQVECGSVGLAWAAADSADAKFQDMGRQKLLVMGRVVGLDPKDPSFTKHWDIAAHEAAAPPAFDGYHMAVAFDDAGAITLGVDPLGLFPVYYTVAGAGCILVSSCSGLLGAHETFDAVLDPRGLASLLMIGNLEGGHTLYRGVRRLSAGHVLRVRSKGDPFEVRNYELRVNSSHHEQPLDECARILDDRLRDACRRHAGSGSMRTLMLSGGLDSRLLAGMLRREGVPTISVTHGARTDAEQALARRVASRVGIAHRRLTSTPRAVDFWRQIEWDALTATPAFENTHFMRELAPFNPDVVCGYLMDAIVGGSHIEWCYDAARRECGFDPFFRSSNAWGIQLSELKALVRRDVFGDGVDEAYAAIQQTYESYSDSNMERAWLFDLNHRQRHWIGHSMPALACSGAWPSFPHADRDVLRAAAGVPLPMLAGRRIERRILTLLYPELARIPLDAGTMSIDHLDARRWRLLAALVREGVRSRVGALYARLRGRKDQSYYSMMDFNSPHWMQVRDAAEQHRELAYSLFERSALDRLLPPAGDRSQAPGEGGRALLGVVAWLSLSGIQIK